VRQDLEEKSFHHEGREEHEVNRGKIYEKSYGKIYEKSLLLPAPLPPKRSSWA
jgi:hypothetical protein